MKVAITQIVLQHHRCIQALALLPASLLLYKFHEIGFSLFISGLPYAIGHARKSGYRAKAKNQVEFVNERVRGVYA
jgi:hypothetical protein